MSNTKADPVGIVVIGRNEGERLRRCLDSVGDGIGAVVYVDSGSTDGSPEHARSRGVETLALDLSRPFSAGRARNAGAELLLEGHPDLAFIQFIDGDCEIVDGWLDRGLETLAERDDVAAVAGRVRERSPDASIYNRLCDMEWDAPPGTARSVGGVAMVRVRAFVEAEGFDETLVAGEEPEMCFRMRQRGWSIQRVDHDMARHDAEMTRFAQWWRRSVRAGYAYAEGRAMHGSSPERYYVSEVRSIIEWGLLLPLLVLVLLWPSYGASAVLLGLYPVQTYRIRQQRARAGEMRDDAALYARYCMLGKFPQLIGVGRYFLGRLLGRRSSIIEYKGASVGA